MSRLPTVLLRHETPAGIHYDWLLADPRTAGDPRARLWTARVAHPSTAWAALGAWDLEPIAPHRRIYLTYEGPIAAAPPPPESAPALPPEAEAAEESSPPHFQPSPANQSSPSQGQPDRGSVRRVDEGTFICRHWDDDRFVIDLFFRALTGRVEAVRQSPTLWRARLRESISAEG